MENNITPKLNIYAPQDSMYGLSSDLTQPNLTTYYDPNTGVTNNKVVTSPSSSNKASLQIPVGSTPAYPTLKKGDIWNDGTLHMYSQNMTQSFSYMLGNETVSGTPSATYTVSGDSTTGSVQRLLTSANNNMPFIDVSQIKAGLNVYIKCMGYLSTNALNSKYDISFNFYDGNFYPFNPVFICQAPSASITNNLSNEYFSIECIANIRSLGIGGTVVGQGLFQYMDTGTLKGAGMVNTSTASVDTTQSLGIGIEVNAQAGDKITFNCTNSFIQIF